MPDYIPYTPEEYAPEAPATSQHFARWFQNWEAGFAGAIGAPRLGIGALPRLAPGNVVKFARDGLVTGRSGGFSFAQNGTVRVTWQDYSQPGGTSTLVRRRSDIEVTVASFAGTSSWMARTVDLAVLAGDFIQVRGVESVRLLRLQTDGADIWPGVEGMTPIINGSV